MTTVCDPLQLLQEYFGFGEFRDGQRQVIDALLEGHSAAEIAADLNMNAKSVRQAKYRVLTRLRQELADK